MRPGGKCRCFECLSISARRPPELRAAAAICLRKRRLRRWEDVVFTVQVVFFVLGMLEVGVFFFNMFFLQVVVALIFPSNKKHLMEGFGVEPAPKRTRSLDFRSSCAMHILRASPVARKPFEASEDDIIFSFPWDFTKFECSKTKYDSSVFFWKDHRLLLLLNPSLFDQHLVEEDQGSFCKETSNGLPKEEDHVEGNIASLSFIFERDARLFASFMMSCCSRYPWISHENP